MSQVSSLALVKPRFELIAQFDACWFMCEACTASEGRVAIYKDVIQPESVVTCLCCVLKRAGHFTVAVTCLQSALFDIWGNKQRVPPHFELITIRTSCATERDFFGSWNIAIDRHLPPRTL